MTPSTFDFAPLDAFFRGPAIREKLWSKTCQDLHEYFITCAVTAPAWPDSSLMVERATAGWILPGEYSLNELQDRFSPRYRDNPHMPDPTYQVVAAKTIEALSGMLRAALLMPVHAQLLEQASAEGLDLGALHQLALSSIGPALCRGLVAEVGSARVRLSPEYLRDAGERRILNEVVLAQEEKHRQRNAHAGKERYGQLLKKWVTSSGDIHGVHIATGSELADDLIDWLQTLDTSDAAIFLENHNPSARSAAKYGMSPALYASIANGELSLVPPPDPKVYARLRTLIATLLSISGYRRITLTWPDNTYARIDIDQFNRVGSAEVHVAHLVEALLKGLKTQAGVMVRAWQAENINVFIPEKGGFSQVSVKHMYGALLERGQVVGLSSRQVQGAMTKNNGTGDEVPREPSIRCLDWPSGPRWFGARPSGEMS